MKGKRAIVWFRQDLRLHDNEAISEALQNADEIVPVYVFDERIFNGKTRFGFPKISYFRAKFIIESIIDLRQSLEKIGSKLIVRIGNPEEELFLIAQQVKSSWIYCNRERTEEELNVQNALEKKLWSIGQELRYTRGKMLYYTQDLPFPITHTPDIFTQFRKEVERITPIRSPLPAPKYLAPISSIEIVTGIIPSVTDFDITIIEKMSNDVMHFVGGETAALQRLQYFIWEADLLKNYEETRNGMIGADYSTKLSPWLSQGCISPKTIYEEIKKYENEKGANKSTYWLFFELLWRDFFRLMAKKHGNAIFKAGGTLEKPDTSLRNDEHLLKLWAEARTGIPFIDANVRELRQTGFMSNRGRQNVASFLIKDLHVNWQMGAEYFESMLIDYDVASNWCNWNYIAGVGSDPRENRYFNILSQAQRYDPKGDYVKCWIPELKDVPPEKIHRPDLLDETEQRLYNVKLGVQYPKPMVNIAKWD